MSDIIKKWGVTHHEARMSPANFWAAVDQAGWGRHKDYNKVKAFFLERFSEKEADEFRAQFSDLKNKLARELDAWAKDEDGKDWGMGDDSWGDFLAHIIGLGKREYDAVMRDPQKAYDRAQRNDYRESFAYGIPWKDDYADKARQPQSTDTVDVFGAWALPDNFRKNTIQKMEAEIKDLWALRVSLLKWKSLNDETSKTFLSMGAWAEKRRGPNVGPRDYYDWISSGFQELMHGNSRWGVGYSRGTGLQVQALVDEIDSRTDFLRGVIKELKTTKRPSGA